MGFLKRFRNWITGKGWKEEEKQKIEEKEEEQEIEPRTSIEEEQGIKEEKKEEKQERTWKIREAKEEGAEEELRKAIRTYNKAPEKAKIEREIRPEVENRITMGTQIFGDLSGLKPQYTKIFTENAKLNDPDILEVLFKGRGQLQHRFTTNIKTRIEGKEANTLEIVGTLIEHTGMTFNYINIGMQIDSPPQLDQLLLELGQAFESNFGAISSGLKSRNTHKGKITDIEIEVTFA